MQLSVSDVTRLLNVSEKTVYRWIKQNKLPAYKINEQYRFSRAELLEWATSKRINVSVDIFVDKDEPGMAACSLSSALSAGGIHYRIGGADKAAVLKSVIDVMSLPDEVDRALLYKVLLAREDLGSTAIGEGVAIPHVRNPIVMHITKPMVTLCFLERPIEFGALDGKPVHTLFTIVSPSIKVHLNLLSRLSYILRQPEFIRLITEQALRDVIYSFVTQFESGLVKAGAGFSENLK